MPVKSTISRLPTRLRAAVDDALRSGATIDEIVQLLDELGAKASRSAVGRYAQDARRLMERTERSREMAKIVVGRIADDPEGNTVRGVSAILQSLIWEFLDPVDEGQRPTLVPKDFHDLAKAVHHIQAGDKANADKALKVQEEARRLAVVEAAKVAKDTATKAGASAATIDRIYREVLKVGG